MVNKVRFLELNKLGYPWAYYYNPNWTTSTDLVTHSSGELLPLRGRQHTTTSDHRWNELSSSGMDVGGDFVTRRIKRFETHNCDGFETKLQYGRKYVGPQFPMDPYVRIEAYTGTPPVVDWAKLDKLGATAIARTIPTNPASDVSTMLGELKSGLPKMVGSALVKSKLKDYRKVGDEYLNVEFGWKPLISDAQKFAQAAIDSEKILKQLQRDSGKLIRRKYHFPDEVNDYVTQSRWTPWVPAPVTAYEISPGQVRTDTNITTKTWFSGAYTYHVNLGTRLNDRLERHAAEARRLFGLEITPAVLWNLAPWSWAVDWEGNIGDVLHNVSRFAQDGLVLRHGYIMQETTQTLTWTLLDGGLYNNIPFRQPSMTMEIVTKVRRRATPFGFGLNPTALTGRQMAILGALGLSKGPRR